ncbi:MAG: DUF499 domain-containing protein [Prochlorothrix sp.]|nr:DUF499 domain-containing protein [Prochlorothrix sp.]
MSLPTIFELCDLREDVRQGRIGETDFAADLALVIQGSAPPDYQDPKRFFANTHPTRGLKQLLNAVCQRLQGHTEQVGSIFRLDTEYGGGKTHSLIGLYHTMQGLAGVESAADFIDPSLIPQGPVRVAAFDGENADPVNGRSMGDGIYAKTPWGELAYLLAGVAGYRRIQASDAEGTAPGADTLRELFGGEPTLILLDELSIYLRKLKSRDRDRTGGQLTAFLTGLIKAVESSPRAALVFTLAIGKEGKATDAYSEENQFIAAKMDELMSVAARKATLLDPTEEDETVKVLRRRLFRQIDDDQAEVVIQAYQQIWNQHRDELAAASTASLDQQVMAFRQGYPLHPELIETLRDKTSTLTKFQRVRGMLRLLTRTVAALWQQAPIATHAIHLHHLDLGIKGIRDEVLVRMEQSSYLGAIRGDVAGVDQDQDALAQALDRQHYRGLSPYASYVARVVLFHSLAFNEALKGVSKPRLRYAIAAPGLEYGFVEDALRRFVQESAYLDDRPSAPLRFLTEANLTQMIHQKEKVIDPGEVRQQLNDRIREIFKGKPFELVPFPGGPYEVADDTNDGIPYLAVIHYEAEAVSVQNPEIPPLVRRIYLEKGNGSSTRTHRNHLVFLCIDSGQVEAVKRKVIRRLALRELLKPDAMAQLAPHQQEKLKEEEKNSETALAIAIQKAYCCLFYPEHRGGETPLTLATVEEHRAAAAPGAGQKAIVSTLKAARSKLRLPEDQPDSPSSLRDNTLLRKGEITTAALREEFYKSPSLPMLIGNEVFFKGIIQGIEAGLLIYKSGDLIWGKGDAPASIKVDSNSYIYTIDQAEELDIWPRKLELTPPPGADAGDSASGYGGSTDGTTTKRAGDKGGDWSTGGDRPGPNPTPPVPKTEPKTFTAEATLREALTQVFEQAQFAKVKYLQSLEILVFSASDAFMVLGPLKGLREAQVSVVLEVSYETQGGSEVSLSLEGTVDDALNLQSFVGGQLRAAVSSDGEATFTAEFTAGFSVVGDAPEKLRDKLCKLGAGSAQVRAVALEAETPAQVVDPET